MKGPFGHKDNNNVSITKITLYKIAKVIDINNGNRKNTNQINIEPLCSNLNLRASINIRSYIHT